MSKEQATLPVDMLDSIQQIREVNPGLWIEDHCKIINKNGDLVPLIANEAQLILMRAIQSQIDAGKPIRIIILKARQRGMTTWGAALLYCWCNTKQNRNALISAQDDDAATGIFRRVKLYQTQNPIQIPTLYSTRKEITYDDPHRSSILVKTAGKEQLGRSDTIHYVHLSEVSFYANAKNTLLSVLQCVPKNNPDTSVILESSPNSMGGEFYQRWIAAKAGKSDFIPVFLPWWSEAEYSTPSPPDMSLTDIELELKTAYNLKNDQLQWRRNTIANDCGGDEELFKQEYASNDIECFLTSGRPFFNMTRLASMAKLTKVPHIVGNIRLTEESHSQLPAYRVVVDPDPKGYLEVWDPPQKGAYYAIGADTAEGKKDDDQKNPDSNSAHVIRLDQRKVVAKLSGCYEPDLFGEDLNALGRWYNNAYLGVEINNTSGGSVRTTIIRCGYPNLHYHEVWDGLTERMTRRVGFYTDRATRMPILTDLGAEVRNMRLYIPSSQTIAQMMSFVYDKFGKAQARAGEHDDDVLGLSIAFHMAMVYAEANPDLNISTQTNMPSVDQRQDPKQSSKYAGGYEQDPVPCDIELLGIDLDDAAGYLWSA